MRQIVREPAVTETVTKQIRAAILSGALSPGTRIRQEELADRLAVSRAPIRQALLVLEREGLVEIDRWRGTIVTPLDASTIRDVYEFRRAIESDVAIVLAERRDFAPKQSREVVAAGRTAASTGDLTRLIELDLRFHTGLYDAIGNRVLSEVMGGQWTHIRRIMAATLTITGYPEKVWDEHLAILDAIESHDATRAGALAAAHTQAACSVLVASLAQERVAPSDPVLQPKTRRRSRRSRPRRDRSRSASPRPLD